MQSILLALFGGAALTAARPQVEGNRTNLYFLYVKAYLDIFHAPGVISVPADVQLPEGFVVANVIKHCKTGEAIYVNAASINPEVKSKYL